jgi:hypothetical protein
MPLARKPSLKFGQKPRDDLSANAATVECALPIRTASNGIFARPINRMDDDAVQAALATVCAYVQRECRDGVLVQLRKQRRAANQRALVARRKTEQLQLEVAFLRMLNDFLMKQLRKLNSKVELALHMLRGLGVELGLAAQP